MTGPGVGGGWVLREMNTMLPSADGGTWGGAVAVVARVVRVTPPVVLARVGGGAVTALVEVAGRSDVVDVAVVVDLRGKARTGGTVSASTVTTPATPPSTRHAIATATIRRILSAPGCITE